MFFIYISNKGEKEYFINYCKRLYDNGIEIFLLEYSKKQEIVNEIDKYCKEHNYKYYASKTLDLLAK